MSSFKSHSWKIGLIGVCAMGVMFAQPRAGLRGFGGFGGRGALSGGMLRGTVTGAPFSATQTTEMQRTLANGTKIQNIRQSQVYRDAQGRVRIDTTFGPSQSGGGAMRKAVTVIYDPVAGYLYRLNPQKMTAVKSAIPPQTAQAGTKPARTPRAGVQVQTQNLGTATVNGVSATGTQVTTTIAAGTIGNSAPIEIVRTRWVSTQLQIPVQVSVSDPRSGNRSMNLTNIVPTAPAASLFQVPSGYTVTDAPARAFQR